MTDFSAEQKRYLEGFATGVGAVRAMGGITGAAPAAKAEPTGPDAIHLKAQDRVAAAGGKLSDQEKWKRAEHPFDGYSRLKADADAGVAPKPDDNFRFRYHGLFWVAPNQVSYMCRLRIPNGILKHWQFAGLADLADRHGGPYCHVTTRANLQIREIGPEHAVPLLEGLVDIGLTARGSGADNIRNVTGSPTAGIDVREILDTRPLARSWHFHILNDRSLFGLPRKFNVAFDGGGIVPVLEETNDIGFQAVRVRDGAGVEPGVWMRLVLGGISGHKDLARDTGVVCRPSECDAVADAILRVFIENGDRTNRNKARMKYVLDAWGFEKYLAAVEEKLGRKLDRVAPDVVEPRGPFDRFAHIGVHRQAQTGLNWIGVLLPVGRMTTDQMRALAEIARECGDGDIRLTVWQNFLFSGVPDAKVAEVETRIAALGLSISATSMQAGLVACTGATGCKFAAAHTKEWALAIAEHVDARLRLDVPVNVHVTGCHNSCAQHYIGDIGLIGAKVPVGDEGDTVEGFDIVVGGGFADDPKIGRELWTGVKAEDCPARVETILRAYLAGRSGPEENVAQWTRRHEVEVLRGLIQSSGVSSPAPHASVLAEGEPRSTQDRGASFEAPLRGAPQDEEGRVGEAA